MKSMPAASAMRARRRQSGQLADQRSGTLVAERPDEQLAPKMPIFSALPLYMAMRSRIDALRTNKAVSIGLRNAMLPGAQECQSVPAFASFSARRSTRDWGRQD